MATHLMTRLTPQRTASATFPGPSMHYSKQAFWPLYIGYIALPLTAGLDKFYRRLADWDAYASPAFASLFGGNVRLMMQIVGGVEILAAVIVALRPRWGSLIVAAWLAGTILNLLLIPAYLDVALRDFCLLLGAIALSRLSVLVGR